MGQYTEGRVARLGRYNYHQIYRAYPQISRMSDDEYYEEETLSRRSNTSAKGDEAFAKKKSGLKKSELDEQLKEYINEWRKTREKEEEELKRMKEKQAKRKEIRAEQEKK